MKYKIKKAGSYAASQVGPVFTFEEGQVIDDASPKITAFMIATMLGADEPCCVVCDDAAPADEGTGDSETGDADLSTDETGDDEAEGADEPPVAGLDDADVALGVLKFSIAAIDVPGMMLELADAAANKSDAKVAIELWARENLGGFEVDRRKSLEDVQMSVVTEADRMLNA